MIHVYYSSVGKESALALTERIQSLGAPVKAHPQDDGDFSKERGDLCVNWGATASRFGTKARWLNKGAFFNKLEHLRLFHNAGVPVPEVRMERPADGKWYARRLEHRDGNDLLQGLVRGDYYVRHVDTTREFRAHVFRGEVLRASLKVRSDRFLEPGESANDVIRTGNGWVFSERNYRSDVPTLCRASARAVETLGYDFGGVDVGEQPDGSPIVFEVNSAPWLGGEMQRSYAERIIQIAGG